MSVILFGYYGFNNAGDELLLDETVKLIQELSRPFVVANGPIPTPFPMFNRWNLFSWIKHLTRAKAIVFGGGSVFQSSTSTWSLLYYVWIVQLAGWCQTKVILLCHGWGPFKHPWHERLASWALRSAKRSWRLQTTSPRFLMDPVFCDLTLTQGGSPVVKATDEVVMCVRPKIDKEVWSVINGQFSSVTRLTCQVTSGQRSLLDIWNSDAMSPSLVVTDRYHVGIWAIRRGVPWVGISTDPKLVDLAGRTKQTCHASVSDFRHVDKEPLTTNNPLVDWAKQWPPIRPTIREWLHASIDH